MISQALERDVRDGRTHGRKVIKFHEEVHRRLRIIDGEMTTKEAKQILDKINNRSQLQVEPRRRIKN